MDSSTTFKLEERARKADAAVKEIVAEIEALQSGKRIDVDQTENAKLQALIEENHKLAYQLDILKESIRREKGLPATKRAHTVQRDESVGVNIFAELEELFTASIRAAYPSLQVPSAVAPVSSRQKTNARFQCNAAMTITGVLKKQGEKVNPVDVANKIVANLPTCDFVERTEVVGAGFINIFINDAFIAAQITKIVRRGVLPPAAKKLRVALDLSSPNIAKEMHVGHLRSTIIGDVLGRILTFVGHDVVRINHVGDWGTQFGMLIAHLKDKFPNYLTVSPPIGDLQSFYKESKVRFDNEPDFKTRAYQEVVKLQSRDPDVTKAWHLICDVSRKEFADIYRRLDVSLEEKGESFYQDLMNGVVTELESKGLLQDDETAPGRKIVWTDVKDAENPLIVVKSDGGFTYDTSDLATLRYRIEVEKADWLVYVVDSGQSLHFQLVYACGKKVGWWNPDTVRIDHVGFGVVLGEDGKRFKTRSGETVRLKDLLDEGIERASTTLAERKQNLTPEEQKRLIEAVAYGCIRYADLSHNRLNDYEFSFDKMLSDKGNTAVYLLYAYARICSILRNPAIQATGVNVDEVLAHHEVVLAHEKEVKLAQHLARFPEIIHRITQDLFPNSLCDFLYETCGNFTDFYESCYVVAKDASGNASVDRNRLCLVKATALVIAKGLDLLGIKTVERM